MNLSTHFHNDTKVRVSFRTADQALVGDPYAVIRLIEGGSLDLFIDETPARALHAALGACLPGTPAPLNLRLAEMLKEAVERILPGMNGQTTADEEIAGEFSSRAAALLAEIDPGANPEGGA